MESIKGKFTEEQLEQAIIQLFRDQKYSYINGGDIHRRFEDVLLENVIKTYLRKRYEDDNLSANEVSTIINKLKFISDSPLYEGSRETYWLLNEGFDLPREDTSKTALHIDYIDFENLANNDYKNSQPIHRNRPSDTTSGHAHLCEWNTRGDLRVQDGYRGRHDHP